MLSTPDHRHGLGVPAKAEVREFRPAAITTAQRALILTPDGAVISGGQAEISGRDGRWQATVRNLDRAGALASLYYTSGVREVILRLDDGRRARGRIVRTRFLPSAERVCDLAGVGRFA